MLNGGIDELDGRLIEALRENPRVGLLEISRQVGVARGTVQARLSKLEQRGVVTGYGPEIDPAAMGYAILAFVLMDLTQGRLADAVEVIRQVPEVIEADAISGPHDVIARVVARDTEHLQEVVNRLVASDAIERSTSYIVMTRQVPPRMSPLVAKAAGS
jgi:DNA-binding Lrp family transcriptional regulator